VTELIQSVGLQLHFEALSNNLKLRSIIMNDILSNLKDFVLQEEKDGLNIVEVVQHGCKSGVVNSLIYYNDTVAFYDKHEDEIWALAVDEADNLFSGNVFSYLAQLQGAADITGRSTMKNLMAWWAVEETCKNIISERVNKAQEYQDQRDAEAIND
jgi:hypothetical protein